MLLIRDHYLCLIFDKGSWLDCPPCSSRPTHYCHSCHAHCLVLEYQ